MQMLQKNFIKVEGLLPTPSYTQKLTSSFNEISIIVIFEIEHSLKTPLQYQWLSDIKIIWKRNILVKFDYIQEFYVNENTIQKGIKYSLLELSNTFKKEFIAYPKPYYPPTAKELYKRLVWYAMRINTKELLTIEILYATAMRMNSKLSDKYKNAELYKKSFLAYNYVRENQTIKTKKEVLKIKKRNGVKRGMLITKEFQERVSKVKELLPLHVKANGKPNVTAISKVLKIRRETVSRIMKIISMTLFVIWFKSSLIVYENNIVADGYTILPSATVTLLGKLYRWGGVVKSLQLYKLKTDCLVAILCELFFKYFE